MQARFSFYWLMLGLLLPVFANAQFRKKPPTSAPVSQPKPAPKTAVPKPITKPKPLVADTAKPITTKPAPADTIATKQLEPVPKPSTTIRPGGGDATVTDTIPPKPSTKIRPGGGVATTDTARLTANDSTNNITDTTPKKRMVIRPGGAVPEDQMRIATDSSGKEKLIKKLKDTKLPENIIVRVKNMGPLEMLKMTEEHQQNVLDEASGEEMLVTTKIKYYEDYIIGFVRKAPLRYSNLSEIENIIIDIPVVYCSTTCSDGQKHCGHMGELAGLIETYKCTNWKLMVEEEAADPAFGDPLGIGGKNAKGVKQKKGKKSKQRTGETGVE